MNAIWVIEQENPDQNKNNEKSEQIHLGTKGSPRKENPGHHHFDSSATVAATSAMLEKYFKHSDLN